MSKDSAMNMQSLLDQLLRSGQSMLSGTPGNPAQPAAPGKPGYANFGTGMLAGGALGLLLGDKRLRKFGGKALTYGGAAALDALAFRAYSNGQQQRPTMPTATPATPALRSWIDQKVSRPLDPADVAAAANSMEVASEMYLVSMLAVDAESFMERAYLDALANKLNLPTDLKTHLENEARQALAAA